MTSIADIYEDMSYGPAPEQAAPVLDWLKRHGAKFDLFIDGRWTPPLGRAELIESRNPATGELLAAFPSAGRADVDAAVGAAGRAFARWSRLSGHERARHLYALARLIQKNSRFLAVLETLDNGKPIRESRDIDIPLAARHFYHHAGWAQLLEQEFPGHVPLGVAGQIIPWNFPLLMLSWKIAPALAAGNCVVLKPAEYTSLTALYFAELCLEAGLPPGVVNIITGAGETGSLLAEHPDVAKVAFTGSTEVGRMIREKTAGTGKKLTLELGGKSPFMVFDDADLDAAVEGLVDAIWFNQGQVCCAGSRLLAEESIAVRLEDGIKRRLESFRVGDPLDKAVDMGAVIDPVQRGRIDAIVQKGVAEGARMWRPSIPMPKQGCFYPPTLLSDVAPANTAVQEEIFGPVLTLMSFRTLKEGIELANNTRYGLAASVWSENINRALEAAALLKAGVVWINCTNRFDAASGFGGYRESGFGREGGREGMLEYLKPDGDWLPAGRAVLAAPSPREPEPPEPDGAVSIDRTHKHYIGGKQKRADGGLSRQVIAHDGRLAGRVADGNRKDIRDAVEAAFKAEGWARTAAHNRAQVLYFLAENLSVRRKEFTGDLRTLTGAGEEEAAAETDAAISRLFSYAAWADKFDGAVHAGPQRQMVLAVHEPVGVMGVVCPDVNPLLSLVSLIAPVLAMGNRAVVIPSQCYPTLATNFYQVLETSDVPGGVVNIVTGERDALAFVLADHDQVDGIWYFGGAQGSREVERRSAANLKRMWVNYGKGRDWLSSEHGEGRRFLMEACQIKNIWLPYGD